MTAPNEAALARRLRDARRAARLTQEQVAQVTALSRSAVSEIETGGRAVSALELLGLARLYRVPVGWLLGESLDGVAPGDVLASVVAGLRLSEVDREVGS